MKPALLTLLTCLSFLASSTFAEDRKRINEDWDKRETRTADDLIPYTALRDAVTGEMGDLARALRSVDQSFAYRGMRGCGSCTAGSVFVDFHAKGIEPPKNVRILPPPPLNLSGRKYIDNCKTCGEDFVECHGCQSRNVAVHAPCHSCNEKQHTGPQLVAPQLAETQSADQFRFAFTISLPEANCSKFTPILTMGDDWSDANFSLGQLGNQLRFRFLTDAQDQFGSFQHEVNLGDLGTGKHNVSFAYQPGALAINVDGSHFGTLNVQGGLHSWKREELLINTESWHGEISNLKVLHHIHEDLPADDVR